MIMILEKDRHSIINLKYKTKNKKINIVMNTQINN